MDFKKIASSVGSSFNRVVQLTEEKIGNAEKTEYDPHFLDLCRKAEQTQKWTEKVLKGVEGMLQPNPALRMEEFVMDKLEKKKKDRLTPAEELGGAMVDAGNELGAGSTYGNALIKCGQTENKVGLAERALINSATHSFIAPLRRFLDEDMKTIEKEQKTLENNRLDLDAAKLKLKRAKTEAARKPEKDQVNDDLVSKAETELAQAQNVFDKQMEVTTLLLEKVEASQGHHVQCLNELIDGQMTYYAQCHQLMQELQRQLGSS